MGFIYTSQAGILEEMLEDTMESLDPEDDEEEVDAAVENILFELTEGKWHCVYSLNSLRVSGIVFIESMLYFWECRLYV